MPTLLQCECFCILVLVGSLGDIWGVDADVIREQLLWSLVLTAQEMSASLACSLTHTVSLVYHCLFSSHLDWPSFTNWNTSLITFNWCLYLITRLSIRLVYDINNKQTGCWCSHVRLLSNHRYPWLPSLPQVTGMKIDLAKNSSKGEPASQVLSSSSYVFKRLLSTVSRYSERTLWLILENVMLVEL